jgi:hypothetical protein
MKKYIFILLSVILILALISCQATETVSDSKETTGNTPIITSTPSRTKKPVLSEEEKANVSRYNELFSYCQEFNDWYAAVLLKEMLVQGKITYDQFSAIYEIDFFYKAKKFDDNLWMQIKNQLNEIADTINGHTNDISETDMNNYYNYLCSSAKQDIFYLSMFESKDKIQRMAQAVNDIHVWFKNPTEENFIPIQNTFLSGDLSSGEIVMLSCYLYNSPRLPDKVESEIQYIDSLVYLNEHGVNKLGD